MKKSAENLRVTKNEIFKQSLITSIFALALIIVFNELTNKAFTSQDLRESMVTAIFNRENLVMLAAFAITLTVANYWRLDDINNKNDFRTAKLINPFKCKKTISEHGDNTKNSDNNSISEKKYIDNTKLNNRDVLTGLYNHRYFHEHCEEIMKVNNFTSLALILIDIDKFKSINRAFGYVEGDNVLVKISNIIINKVKENDLLNNSVITRYGGEEILILLKNTDEESAYTMADEIRKSVYTSNIFGEKFEKNRISISSGVASINSPTKLNNIDELVEAAYLAMINSKANGRNKTSIYKAIHKTFKREPSNDQGIHKSVFALASTIDAKDEYTGHHSSLVSYYSTLIANKMELDSETIDSIETGSLLHDIGKISTPDAIITKNSKLTDEEYEIVKQHPTTGYDIVKLLTNDKISLDCIKYHHERWDGRGYPARLKGEEIPVAARVVCIADAFHAMTSNRSYREAQNVDWAIEELIKNKGTQFDPSIVDIFVPMAKTLRH